MKHFSVLLLVTIFSFCSCAVQFKDCGSTAGSFSRVVVSNCDDSKNHCVLKRNSNVTITIDFEANVESIETLTAIVHGTVLGIEMPFPLPQPNACESGVECPLTKSKKYEYVATLPVLKSYPKVKVGVKWELKDEQGVDVVCVEIPAKIE